MQNVLKRISMYLFEGFRFIFEFFSKKRTFVVYDHSESIDMHIRKQMCVFLLTPADLFYLRL